MGGVRGPVHEVDQAKRSSIALAIEWWAVGQVFYRSSLHSTQKRAGRDSGHSPVPLGRIAPRRAFCDVLVLHINMLMPVFEYSMQNYSCTYDYNYSNNQYGVIP